MRQVPLDQFAHIPLYSVDIELHVRSKCCATLLGLLVMIDYP
jgi:hypothetical protein